MSDHYDDELGSHDEELNEVRDDDNDDEENRNNDIDTSEEEEEENEEELEKVSNTMLLNSVLPCNAP